jgi:hypothetical protein
VTKIHFSDKGIILNEKNAENCICIMDMSCNLF